MTFYHYTPSTNLASIKKNGLYHFGIAWFTTSEEPEPTVSIATEFTKVPQGRIVVKRPHMHKFEEVVTHPYWYNRISNYMNIEILRELVDTSEWYFTIGKITPQDIFRYEVQEEDGTWKEVLNEL